MTAPHMTPAEARADLADLIHTALMDVTLRDLAKAVAGVLSQDAAPECRCGLPMSKNPHPEAGKAGTYTEVGSTWACIPCLTRVANLHFDRSAKMQQRLEQIGAIAGTPTASEVA